MATINTAGTGHGNRSEAYVGGLVVQYNQFPSDSAADGGRIEKVRWAMSVLDDLDRKMGLGSACNVYFRRLPRGRTFRHLWRDPTIFIDYSPSLAAGIFAATHSRAKDVAITRWCIDNHDHWTIGASIVHEFGHIGGAPGRASHAAERAVKECGFGAQYDPSIVGSLRSLAKMLRNMA